MEHELFMTLYETTLPQCTTKTHTAVNTFPSQHVVVKDHMLYKMMKFLHISEYVSRICKCWNQGI